MQKQCEFTMMLEDKELIFRLQRLAPRDLMETIHKFFEVGESKMSFDDTLKIANKVFKNAFVECDGEVVEIRDVCEYFWDKLDIFYECLPAALQAMAPDLFRRLERKAAAL